MQFTPLGPWGVGASAGPATEGLKGLSGRVADPNPVEQDQGGKGVNIILIKYSLFMDTAMSQHQTVYLIQPHLPTCVYATPPHLSRPDYPST